MATDFEESRRKQKIMWHSIYDYSMGILWLGVGIFFLFAKKFGYELGIDNVLVTIFGCSSILYGLFRVYRGYKKNY